VRKSLGICGGPAISLARCKPENGEVLNTCLRSIFKRSLTQNQQIQHQSIVLDHKRRHLETTNDAITVCVVHVFVVDDNVIFGRHVIGNVVIDNQTQQSVEQRQIDLFVEFLEARFEQNVAFTFVDIPDVLQVVDACEEEV
jgi:hypothetical protein